MLFLSLLCCHLQFWVLPRHLSIGGARQTKVQDLQVTIFIDCHVWRLQVSVIDDVAIIMAIDRESLPVYDPCRMNILEASHDLVDDELHLKLSGGLGKSTGALAISLKRKRFHLVDKRWSQNRIVQFGKKISRGESQKIDELLFKLFSISLSKSDLKRSENETLIRKSSIHSCCHYIP